MVQVYFIKKDIQDIRVVKVETVAVPDQLPRKSNLVYFDGNFLNAKINVAFNPDFPKELTDGLFCLYASTSGAKYYIWLKNDINMPTKISGWFIPMEGLIGQAKTPILIPVVERKFN